MIMLVCGGRGFADFAMMKKTLDAFLVGGVDLVVQGDASGADRMAKAWAHTNGIHYATVPALWDVLGKDAAGPLRNRAMLLIRPDIVVAFPGGAGTADMCRAAEAAGIPIMHVDRTPR